MCELHAHALVDERIEPVGIRTAVSDSIVHQADEALAVGLPVAACNPAHGRCLPSGCASDAGELRPDLACGRSTPEEPVIDTDVRLALVTPRELVLHARP